MYTTLILSIIVTMLFSAFFSGMEIAFVSSNRMLVEMERDRYTLSSRPLQIFFSHPNNFVSTMLVGNNIALVIYGILIARLFDQTIFSGMPESVSVPLDTIISTIIVLFTGEFLPKTIFKSSPNYLLRLFAYPAMICYIVLWPVSRFASLLSHLVLKLSGNKDDASSRDDAFSRVDLDYLVQATIDNASDPAQLDAEVKIFQNALEFQDTKVRDCMVPRTEIVAVLSCSLHRSLTSI